MNKVLRGIDAGLKWTGIMFLILLFLCTITQVFFRYVLNNPLPWPEEIGCYLFIWVTYIGLVKNIKENDFFKIDFLLLKLSPRGKAAVNFVFYCLMLWFLAVAFLGSFDLLRSNRHILSANLITVNVVYSSLPVMSVFMMAYIVADLFKTLGFILRGKEFGKNPEERHT